MKDHKSEALRKQRFSEINDRLRRLKPDAVRKFILTKGFYPEEQFLPLDFFQSTDLGNVPSTHNVLYKDGNFDRNAIKSAKPTLLEYPKTQYTKRALGIPNATNYVYLTDLVTSNWKIITKLLKLDFKHDLIIPYSYPLFYDLQKRSEISINNFKQFYEFDLRERAHEYPYQLFLDIKNFYPSVYTHAIAWAIDDQTRLPSKFQDYTLFANQMDLATRHLNENKTKGILIGPTSSDLISEVLLRKVDYLFSEKMQTEKDNFLAGRFKDDYIFLVKDEPLAERILYILQDVLSNSFHFDINEGKTKIVKGFFEENTKLWKIETDKIRDEIRESQKKVTSTSYLVYPEHQLSLWLTKTKQLYKSNEDQYIIKSILGTLTNIDPNIEAICIETRECRNSPYARMASQPYIAVLENIFDLCQKVPSAWPYFFVFLCGLMHKKNYSYRVIKKDLVNYLIGITHEFVEFNNTFPLIWSLYAFWRLKIKLPKFIVNLISRKFKDNWLVMSFIDPSHGKHMVNGKTYSLINTDPAQTKPLFDLINVFTYSDYMESKKS